MLKRERERDLEFIFEGYICGLQTPDCRIGSRVRRRRNNRSENHATQSFSENWDFGVERYCSKLIDPTLQNLVSEVGCSSNHWGMTWKEFKGNLKLAISQSSLNPWALSRSAATDFTISSSRSTFFEALNNNLNITTRSDESKDFYYFVVVDKTPILQNLIKSHRI